MRWCVGRGLAPHSDRHPSDVGTTPLTASAYRSPMDRDGSPMGYSSGSSLGGVMLRAHHCVRCGDPMPVGRRVDRKYCRASCRTSAYRTRRTQTTPRKGARRGTKQTTGEPLSPELLLALRHVPPVILTTLAAWFDEHASSEQLTAARQRITELEQQVQRLRAEQAVQQEAHRRDKERQQADESAQRIHEQKTREAESRQRTDVTSRQVSELQSAVRNLETQVAERTAEIQQERAAHKNTWQTATEQNYEMGLQIRQALEDADRARAETEAVRYELHATQNWYAKSQEKIIAFEQEARERQQSHTQTRISATRESKAARRETRPKRQPRATTRDTATPLRQQPPPEPATYYVPDDGLLMLMKEYVILRDDLARQSISWEGTTQRLPDRTADTIEAHAIRLANKKRHEFYNSDDRRTTFRATWLDYGHRLDEASEAMLQAEVRLKIKKLQKKLGRSM